jgi:hypothetical protein
VRLWEVLDICLRDRCQAWVLKGDGMYSQSQPGGDRDGPETLGTHQTLMDLTRFAAGVPDGPALSGTKLSVNRRLAIPVLDYGLWGCFTFAR